MAPQPREIIAVPAEMKLEDMNVLFGPLSGDEEFVILKPADHWPQLLAKLGVVSHCVDADKLLNNGRWIKGFDCLDVRGPDGTEFEIFAYQPWLFWSKKNATD